MTTYTDERESTDQKLVVLHATGDGDFHNRGLRRYALYRDLGLAEATNGRVQGDITRLIGPCTDEVRRRHYHDVEFQMTYVIQGWIKVELEGEGEVTLRPGSILMLPPRIKHTVLDYSDDCEQLELIMPVKYETIEAR